MTKPRVKRNTFYIYICNLCIWENSTLITIWAIVTEKNRMMYDFSSHFDWWDFLHSLNNLRSTIRFFVWLCSFLFSASWYCCILFVLFVVGFLYLLPHDFVAVAIWQSLLIFIWPVSYQCISFVLVAFLCICFLLFLLFSVSSPSIVRAWRNDVQNKSQTTSDRELIFTIKSTILFGIKTFLLSFTVIYIHTHIILNCISISISIIIASASQHNTIGDPLNVKCAEFCVFLMCGYIFNLIFLNVERPSVAWTSSLASIA